MVPLWTSIKVIPIDDNSDSFFPSINQYQSINDLARFVDRVVFPDRQYKIGLSWMNGKVGVAVYTGI